MSQAKTQQSKGFWQAFKSVEIFGLSLPLYLGIFAIVFLAMLLKWLPGGMLTHG